MKEYPKLFEDVFSSEKLNRRCRPEKISIVGNVTFQSYAKEISSLYIEYEKIIFKFFIKFYLLSSKFCYFGRRKHGLPGKREGHVINRAFSLFVRKYCGFNYRSITLNFSYKIVLSYIKDFFPDIDNIDVENIKYPFSYMNFGCLALVRGLDERMELLEHGEKNKMSFNSFADYVVNYIYCKNDEIGEDKYLLSFTKVIPFPTIIVKK